jgi:diadenosine tetraphosphatase ApaH/serine/threonine PP2A family protein phosphatase
MGRTQAPASSFFAGKNAQVCLGNHDAAVIRKCAVEDFNPFARAAVEWTRSELTRSQLDWLEQLPWTIENDELDAIWVHASLNRPEDFDYVRSVPAAARSLLEQQHRWSFCGHTHVPVLFHASEPEDCVHEPSFESEGYFHFDPLPAQVLLNVGSVGQPRDEDPRAAFVLWDTERNFLRLERVPYDVPATQRKILSKGLPPILAERLAFGL